MYDNDELLLMLDDDLFFREEAETCTTMEATE